MLLIRLQERERDAEEFRVREEFRATEESRHAEEYRDTEEFRATEESRHTEEFRDTEKYRDAEESKQAWSRSTDEENSRRKRRWSSQGQQRVSQIS